MWCHFLLETLQQPLQKQCRRKLAANHVISTLLSYFVLYSDLNILFILKEQIVYCELRLIYTVALLIIVTVFNCQVVELRNIYYTFIVKYPIIFSSFLIKLWICLIMEHLLTSLSAEIFIILITWW